MQQGERTERRVWMSSLNHRILWYVACPLFPHSRRSHVVQLWEENGCNMFFSLLFWSSTSGALLDNNFFALPVKSDFSATSLQLSGYVCSRQERSTENTVQMVEDMRASGIRIFLLNTLLSPAILATAIPIQTYGKAFLSALRYFYPEIKHSVTLVHQVTVLWLDLCTTLSFIAFVLQNTSSSSTR